MRMDRYNTYILKYSVHGGWGQWDGWTQCTMTCGGGNQSRTRVCDNPEPAHGGSQCTDDDSSPQETQTCNDFGCPGTKYGIYISLILQKNIYIHTYICIIQLVFS